MNFLKNPKFSKVAQMWLLQKSVSLKKSTLSNYKYIINKYILVYFKNKRIYFFVNYDFNLYVSKLTKSLAGESVDTILTVFKSLMKYAERMFDVDFKLDLLGTPKKKVKNIEILNSKDTKVLEEYCMANFDIDYRNIGIELSLLTGMRLGEICALKWKNFDFKNRLIKVRKTMQRIYVAKGKTEIHIDDPKTSNSIRNIPIPSKLLTKLKEIYRNNNFTGEEFFLTGKADKFVEPRSLERCFGKCLIVCEIKHFKFHALRHTFATNCINNGMDTKSLSIVLGHSNVRTTLERYVHPTVEVQRKYINML